MYAIRSYYVNRIFGAYMLNSPAIRSYFHKETRTVAQPTLNIKQITETPIIIPTIEKQNQFANLASKQFKIVEQIDVITSYSIHYTKLYDSFAVSALL